MLLVQLQRFNLKFSDLAHCLPKIKQIQKPRMQHEKNCVPVMFIWLLLSETSSLIVICSLDYVSHKWYLSQLNIYFYEERRNWLSLSDVEIPFLLEKIVKRICRNSLSANEIVGVSASKIGDRYTIQGQEPAVRIRCQHEIKKGKTEEK
jgi:hypothetical protein